ncbi:phosphoribosyl-AMP cyclohydrolase [Suttonella ornithocola]|uniref:Phosphoribosyl-AMP cyclohydrolase n=1 Tax=Suttonella ornithocola TaxID=279832 RepID=A0A380MZX0_9GAMM|nr:phosphoribosyl-AMP cyclohydrolase [Suttonella ornithocola]SUO97221.1 phosphoribosyl-AMP cyclohydrolase [Suttonella ornithocola]
MMLDNAKWLEAVRFNADGLVCVVTLDAESGAVLMQAWMNRETLLETVAIGEMVYYSRSRKQRWHKGETSGHTQVVENLWLDCDGDAVLAVVHQKGGIACHTGRHNCFYRCLEDGEWVEKEPVLKSPKEIYG